MIQMLGSSRLFNKTIQEDATSTATNRVIELYKVAELEELNQVPLLIQSSLAGVSGTAYIEIVSDGVTVGTATEIQVFKDNAFDTPYSNWVIANQLYIAVYDFDNDCFNVFPIGGGGSTPEPAPSVLFAVSSAILSLTSSSSAQDIETAFGSADDEEDFINWVNGMTGLIAVFDPDYNSIDYKIIDNYRVTNNGLSYSLFINDYSIINNTMSLVNKVITFNKTTVSDTTFSSVTVNTLTISDGNGVAY